MLEKDSRTHTNTEEKEELHRNLVTLGKDREELQEMVAVLRQEKQQLRTELEDRMETVKHWDECPVSRLSCAIIYSFLRVKIRNSKSQNWSKLL